MSVYALSWAWQQQVGDSSAKLVLLALADHANDSGICWPGVARIAEKSELSRATVKRAIRKLEAFDLIERENRGRADDGVHLTTLYRLKVPAIQAPRARRGSGQAEPGGRVTVSLPSAQAAPGVGSPVTGGRVTGEPLTAKNRQRTGEGGAAAPLADQADGIQSVAEQLVTSCRMAGPLTETERARARTAAAQILRAELERPLDQVLDQVTARAARWPGLFGDATCTPSAIAGNWSRLALPARAVVDQADAERSAEQIRRTEFEGEIRAKLRALDAPAELVRDLGESLEAWSERVSAAYSAHVADLKATHEGRR